MICECVRDYCAFTKPFQRHFPDWVWFHIMKKAFYLFISIFIINGWILIPVPMVILPFFQEQWWCFYAFLFHLTPRACSVAIPSNILMATIQSDTPCLTSSHGAFNWSMLAVIGCNKTTNCCFFFPDCMQASYDWFQYYLLLCYFNIDTQP